MLKSAPPTFSSSKAQCRDFGPLPTGILRCCSRVIALNGSEYVRSLFSTIVRNNISPSLLNEQYSRGILFKRELENDSCPVRMRAVIAVVLSSAWVPSTTTPFAPHASTTPLNAAYELKSKSSYSESALLRRLNVHVRKAAVIADRSAASSRGAGATSATVIVYAGYPAVTSVATGAVSSAVNTLPPRAADTSRGAAAGSTAPP